MAVMVQVVIHMHHVVRVSNERVDDHPKRMGFDTHIIECSCGWVEKAYSPAQCHERANGHLRKAENVSLTPGPTWRS